MYATVAREQMSLAHLLVSLGVDAGVVGGVGAVIGDADAVAANPA